MHSHTNRQRGRSIPPVSRTVVELDDDSKLVTVSVGASDPDPVRVVFEQAVPSPHTLPVGAARRSDGYTDGTVTVTYTVGPRSEARFGYRVRGPVDTALPEPTVEVTPIDDDVDGDDESVTVEWTGGDGTATSLAMSTDTVAAVNTTTLPTITAPAVPTTDALAGTAIGVVLTPDNQDAVVRTVLRASRRGHAVVVTTQGIDDADDSDVQDMLRTLGAILVPPPSGTVSTAQLHQALSRAARELGLPGIVLQTRECPRIDYERTATAFEHADYEVVAIPERWSQSSDTPTVVVAIPAYNAADSIGPVVESALPYADEVVVVDDGSRDGTAERARAAGARPVRPSSSTTATAATAGRSRRRSGRPPRATRPTSSSSTPTGNTTRRTSLSSSKHSGATGRISSSEAGTSASGRRESRSSAPSDWGLSTASRTRVSGNSVRAASSGTHRAATAPTAGSRPGRSRRTR